MAEYQIPISYVVNVSTVIPQQGIEPLKMSTLLILTDDQPVIEIEDYGIYRNSLSVGKAWGTETLVNKMAQAVFSQQPNLLANDGYVIVAKYGTVEDVVQPATSGTLTTSGVATNISNFANVDDGDLTVVVDGVSQVITGLDCSSVTTLQTLATLLQENINDVDVVVEENEIVITSTTTGSTSTVALSATSGGSGTDLYGATYLKGSSAVTVDGQDEVTEERAEYTNEAINRLAGKIYFNGVVTAREISTLEAENASATVQALGNRIFFLNGSDTTVLATGGLFETLQSNDKTKSLYYSYGTNAEENSKIFACAYASRLFAVNYSGSNTTLTMNLKDLANVAADTNISETLLERIKAVGADCFASVEGLPKVLSNKQGGQYIDQVQNRIWFVNSIQREAFNTLARVGTKIPQTEQGMALLENAVRTVCNNAVNNGMLAPGKWNSADTFGNLEDFLENISQFGYYIYHTPVALQSQSEREERKAPLIQIAAKEAGAIHSANILVYLEA